MVLYQKEPKISNFDSINEKTLLPIKHVAQICLWIFCQVCFKYLLSANHHKGIVVLFSSYCRESLYKGSLKKKDET